jgi:hypothetical protein
MKIDFSIEKERKRERERKMGGQRRISVIVDCSLKKFISYFLR